MQESKKAFLGCRISEVKILIMLYCRDKYLQCRILSEKAGSGMAFFKKFNIDFSRAALCAKHWTPKEKYEIQHTFVNYMYVLYADCYDIIDDFFIYNFWNFMKSISHQPHPTQNVFFKKSFVTVIILQYHNHACPYLYM